MTLSKILLTGAATAVLAYSTGAAAGIGCDAINGSKESTINFGNNLTPSFTIPQDAPNGTIIYEETSRVVRQFDLVCANGRIGVFVNPALGSVTSGTVFPLGVPGLSFRLFDSSYLSAPRLFSGNVTMLRDATSYRLEIIKSGELLSQSPIPAVSLGQLRGDDLVIANFNLINPITVNAASCQTPSVTVAMGDDYQLYEFNNSGDTTRVVKFNITLNQCQRGIQKVNYQLNANTPVIDPQKGVVSLNAGSSAKGIGLQLMNAAGQPITLGTPYPFSGFNSTGTEFTIPLSAAYIRLADSSLEAGTANTEVTFILSYL